MRKDKLLAKAKKMSPIGFTTKCLFGGDECVIKSHKSVQTEWGDLWFDAGDVNVCVHEGRDGVDRWSDPHA